MTQMIAIPQSGNSNIVIIRNLSKLESIEKQIQSF